MENMKKFEKQPNNEGKNKEEEVEKVDEESRNP
jgi:hypothetical protein